MSTSFTNMDTNYSAVEWKDISIDSVSNMAKEHGRDIIIVFSWAKKGNLASITTWGRSFHDADNAASGGNSLKQALGWPEEVCNMQSAKVSSLIKANNRLINATAASLQLLQELEEQRIAALDKKNMESLQKELLLALREMDQAFKEEPAATEQEINRMNISVSK